MLWAPLGEDDIFLCLSGVTGATHRCQGQVYALWRHPSHLSGFSCHRPGIHISFGAACGMLCCSNSLIRAGSGMQSCPSQGLTRSREDWAQMPRASPSPRISHHWGQGALQRSGSRSHTPIIPRRRHPTDQGTAHVRVPGRLGWHVPPPLGSTASLYERPALPGIRGGGARKTGMKQKPGLNRMRT